MNEFELKKQQQEGERARQLLKDPMMVKVLREMREAVYHNIETSHFKAVDEREDLYKMLKAIDTFENSFKKRIAGGKVATSKLASIGETAKKIFDYVS